MVDPPSIHSLVQDVQKTLLIDDVFNLLSLYYFITVVNNMKVKIHSIVCKRVVYDINIRIQYM